MIATLLSTSGMAAATTPALSASGAHVTAAHRGGDTAVEVALHATHSPVTIESITTRQARRSGLYLDGNMCDSTSTATKLQTMVIPAGATLTLSTKVAEAIAFDLKEPLVVGTSAIIEVTYSVDGTQSTLRFSAPVSSQPKGIHFP